MTNELVANRKEEIINACEKLYESSGFNEISISSIGDETTFSRTSIYNYFHTKEEIFLALLKREYDKWVEDLNKIYEENEKMTKKNFTKKLALSIQKRKKLLKLVAMNLYEIEENSRLEELVEFKKTYALAVKCVRKCIDKFFTDMEEKDKNNFIVLFFPFMYGIYPYTEATDKQIEAMKIVNIWKEPMSIYEITYTEVLKLLK